MKRVLKILVSPSSTAVAVSLLVLRVGLGASLFVKHGIEKVGGFAHMLPQFPDPLHIGPLPSLVVATAADGVASVLVVLGLATRAAALLIAVNLSVAWLWVHNAQFLGSSADHGELCVVYLCGVVSLAAGGAGPWSFDALIARRLSAGAARGGGVGSAMLD
jgi:putative oxidoreductase